MLRILIASVLTGALGAASAGDPPSPSDAEVRTARESTRAAIDAANRLPPMATEAWMRAGAASAHEKSGEPATAQPNVDTDGRAATDVRSLMARARAGTLFDRNAPICAEARPLVFVSLAMPEPSLRALLEQSRPVGASLVLRGLIDDSMNRTVERLGALLGVDREWVDSNPSISNVSLMIDPTLFERFEVNAVPAFVLPLEVPAPCDAAAGCPTPAHAKLAGDVALSYALEVMSREASDRRVRAAAARWSRKTEGAK